MLPSPPITPALSFQRRSHAVALVFVIALLAESNRKSYTGRTVSQQRRTNLFLISDTASVTARISHKGRRHRYGHYRLIVSAHSCGSSYGRCKVFTGLGVSLGCRPADYQRDVTPPLFPYALRGFEQCYLLIRKLACLAGGFPPHNSYRVFQGNHQQLGEGLAPFV